MYRCLFKDSGGLFLAFASNAVARNMKQEIFAKQGNEQGGKAEWKWMLLALNERTSNIIQFLLGFLTLSLICCSKSIAT